MQDSQFEQLKNQAVVEITCIQDDAIHQLLEAGLPETVALEAMERISAFGLQALWKLDTLYRQYDDFVTRESRTAEHQAWINDNAAASLLQAQTAFATLVAATIQKTIEEYRDKVAHPPKPEKPTITVAPRPSPPQQSLWELAELLLPVLLVPFLVGWFLLLWYMSTSLIFGLIAIGITVFLVVAFQKVGLLIAVIAGLLSLLVLA